MITTNAKTGELYLYGVVGGDWYEEGFTDTEVIAALDNLGGKRAIARINSPGGSADQGIAIYNALKRYSGGVDTVVDSLAASAASVIALAGSTRTTSQGARWMIHRALTLEVGNADQMRKTADVLETYDRSICEIYSQYMGLGTADVMSLMAAETWYTSSESMACGLATHAGETVSDAKPMNAAWFQRPPENLFNPTSPFARVRAKARLEKLTK